MATNYICIECAGMIPCNQSFYSCATCNRISCKTCYLAKNSNKRTHCLPCNL